MVLARRPAGPLHPMLLAWMLAGLLAGLLGGVRPAGAQEAAPPPAAAPRVHEFREVHLGMEVRIAVVAVPAGAESAAAVAAATAVAESAAARAFARIAALEAVLSDWRPMSELSRLAAAPVGEWRPISAELAEVLAVALEVAAATDGAFDPTIGPLTRLWREARRTGVPISDSARAAAREAIGYAAVELDPAVRRVRFLRPGMRLDLGGIAKGWILERAMEEITAAGIRAALVEAGGELVLRGAPPGAKGWRVAVASADGGEMLQLRDIAVSTSSARAQIAPAAGGATEGHVFDPSTARGADPAPQLTVIGPDAAITDALATALPLLPRERWPALAERFGIRIPQL